MECSTSRISFTATVQVRRTTDPSVAYSSFVRHGLTVTERPESPTSQLFMVMRGASPITRGRWPGLQSHRDRGELSRNRLWRTTLRNVGEEHLGCLLARTRRPYPRQASWRPLPVSTLQSKKIR